MIKKVLQLISVVFLKNKLIKSTLSVSRLLDVFFDDWEYSKLKIKLRKNKIKEKFKNKFKLKEVIKIKNKTLLNKITKNKMKNIIKKLNTKILTGSTSNFRKSDIRNVRKSDILTLFRFGFVLIFVFSFCFLFNSNNVFAVDTTKPVVTNFSIPQTSTSLTVPISNFTATDDTGVAGYKLTETPTAPIAGDAGWTEQAPNSYTFSSANNTEPITWTARTGSGSRSWYSIASSADGTKLVAATINGYLYTSSDSGVTWTQRDSARGWWSVSSSADGMKLAATVGYNTNGYIYTSSDGGVTWIQQTGSGLRRWKKIVSSSDGMKLAAIVETGYIYTSSDGGVTWVQQNNSGSRYRSGNLIASSADGTKLIAPVSNGYIYTSSDSGATWTERTNIGINSWSSVASSADGNKLVVVTWNGYIYISSDSGVTWEQRASVRNWYEVSLSADGTKLIASGSPNFGSGIFVSIDSGITWKEISSVTGYSPGTLYLSLSSDGTKIAIAPQGNNNIFTSQFGNRLYAWVKDSAGNVSISSENSISSVLIDFSDPVVTSFFIPSNSDSLNVPITTFTANDGVNNVVGYKITENNNIPFVNDIGWTSSPPIFYTFSSSGSKILYSWVKDSFGNISPSLNDSVFIDLLPSVNLSIPQTSTSLTVPISNFTATDDTGVAGYKLTETPTAPIAGDAGWTEQAPNSYTFSSANNTEPITWTARTGSGSRYWNTITSSADGTKLAAAVSGGYIYISINSGISWTKSNDVPAGWQSIASSSDGTRLVAVGNPSFIYTSIDGGVTWNQRGPYNSWISVASSANGIKLVAVAMSGYIYTSSDGGLTWIQRMDDVGRLWYSVTSSADGTKLAAVVGGQYNTGYIYTSSDSGVTWTQRTVDSARAWNSIASSADGTKLVAVVRGGYIYTSSDSGVTWTQRTNDSVRNWKSVTSSADGTKLVATIGNSATGYIYTSIDSGITWTARTNAGNRSWWASTISSDGTKIAVVNGVPGYVYTSSFGNSIYSWAKDDQGNVSAISPTSIATTLITIPDTTPNNFTFTDQTEKNINTSIESNTITISGIDSASPISITSCTSTLCEYSKNGGAYTSTAGTVLNGDTVKVRQTSSSSGSSTTNLVLDIGGIADTFSVTTFDTTPPTVNITYSSNPAKEGIETISATYSKVISTVPNISISQQGSVSISNVPMANIDGDVWTPQVSAEQNMWYSVTYGNGKFVAVAVDGDHRVMTSTDGVNWTARTAAEQNQWISVTYGNGLFVAVANSGTNRVMTSPDGITWTAQTAPVNDTWSSVVYANGIFVAVGWSNFITSPDGITWTTRTGIPSSNGWTSVTYGNNLFVAVSINNYIATSSDGITWTARTSPSSYNWTSVVYGNSTFVAVSNNGRAMTSTDGVNWTARTVAEQNQWISVTYGNGKFVAVAENGVHRIMTSSDGATWTSQSSPENNPWVNVFFANNTFIAVSYSGIHRVMVLATNISKYSYDYTVNKEDGTNYIDGIATVTLSATTDLNGIFSTDPTNNTFTIDTIPPIVSSFTTPLTSTSLTIPINTFSATDSVGVAGYLITENEIAPLVNDVGWQETAPTEYTFSADGNKTIYAWVKDLSGNVSTSLFSNVSVDNTPPASTINPLCATLGNKCTEAGKILNPEEIYGIQSITGTSLEEISGISKVEISLKNVTTNKWYQDGDFISDTEVYQSVSGANLWSYDVSRFPFTISNVYQINVKGTDLYENVENPVVTKSFKLVNQSFDTTPPIFTLNGENPINVVLGQSYVEAGATALDETDGTRDVTISGTVNTNALGTYTVNYSASDLSGNVGHATRTVNVILASTYNITASAGDHGSISPTGVTMVTSGTNQTYTFTPETSASEVDPPQNYKVSSVTVDGVLVAPVDSYTFTNVSSDHTISVTFSLIDSMPPEITLNGDNPMSLNTGEEYVEPGATAIDVATNEQLEVIISGNVNTNVAGEYKITYVASDLSGNTSTKERIVNVFDVTPPVISDISTPVISSNGAVIVWLTNEPATTQLSWGSASGELTRETVLDPILSTYHVVSLSSSTTDTQGQKNTLDPLVNYFFQVKSVDAGGNDSISEEQTFKTIDTKEIVYVGRSSSENTNTSNIVADTTPPKISNIKISEISSFGAIINFETDEDTLPNVEYGRTEDYGLSSGGDSWNILKKAHSIKLTGLVMGTDYYFRVVAADKSGNITKSENQTFKTKFFIENLNEIAKVDNLEAFQKEIESTIESITPSLVAPFIEKPEISEITENSAVVAFNTNTKSYPVVGYIEDDNYDETKMNPYTLESSDTSKKSTSHKLKISNLKSNTKYRLIAKAFSLPQVTGKSEEVTFFTKASKIRGAIAERKNNSFTIIWTTDEPASSILEYKNRKTGKISKIVDDKKNTSHSVKVENLTPGTTYEVKISGLNNKENIIEGNEKIIVTTSVDVVPPFISNFKIDSALVVGRNDKTQTIVSWQTDEPATSVIYFEEGSGSATKELINKKEDLEMTTNHTAILTTLKPGKVYRFQIASMDDANNLTKLPIRTIITPRPNESIVDVIFKNFDETFNFIKNVK